MTGTELKAFGLINYSDQFWRVVCPYCSSEWQEHKLRLPKILRCPTCKYSSEKLKFAVDGGGEEPPPAGVRNLV